MTERDDQQAADLADFICGEADPNTPEARRLLEQAGLEDAELASLRELAGELDSAGAARDEIMAEAEGLDDAPGIDDVASTLRELARPEPRNRWRWVVPVAAVLMLMPLLLELGSTPTPGPEVYLSSSGDLNISLEKASVVCEVPELQPGESLELRVHDNSDPARPVLIFSETLVDHEWESTESTVAWGDAERISKLPDDKLFELWVVGSGRAEPAGSLTVSPRP